MSPDEEVRAEAIKIAQRSIYGSYVGKDKKRHAKEIVKVAEVYADFIQNGGKPDESSTGR